MRRLGGLLVLFLLLQTGAAVAAPGPGMKLDPRFGRNGVVRVDPGATGRNQGYAAALVGSGNGGFFVLESAVGAGCKRCTDWFLARYGRSGARDRSFGSVPVVRELGQYGYVDLAVDGARRPLLFWKEGNDAIVERLTADGRVDRGFGHRGRFVLHCGCYPERLLALSHGRILLLSEGNERSQRHYKGSIPVLVRIGRDGRLDRGYGVNGIARPRLHGRFSP